LLPLGVSVFADIIFHLTAFDIRPPVTRVLPLVQSPKRAAGSTEETGPGPAWATGKRPPSTTVKGKEPPIGIP
jgi:hypothetical protein